MKRATRPVCRARQRGVSIITAIFLLLLMGGLAAYLANIIAATHLNAAADVGGARAYQAARAGVEWGMYQLDPNAQSAGLPSCVGGSPPIPGHLVNVSCQSWDYTEGSRLVRIFKIISVADAVGAKPPGIQRRLEVTMEKCRDSTITVAPYDC